MQAEVEPQIATTMERAVGDAWQQQTDSKAQSLGHSLWVTAALFPNGRHRLLPCRTLETLSLNVGAFRSISRCECRVRGVALATAILTQQRSDPAGTALDLRLHPGHQQCTWRLLSAHRPVSAAPGLRLSPHGSWLHHRSRRCHTIRWMRQAEAPTPLRCTRPQAATSGTRRRCLRTLCPPGMQTHITLAARKQPVWLQPMRR